MAPVGWWGSVDAYRNASGAAQWPEALPLSGVVVTRYGHLPPACAHGATPCGRIRLLEAAHPTPDAAGCHAAQMVLDAVAEAGPDDRVVCLLSGGETTVTLPRKPADPLLPARGGRNSEFLLALALALDGAAHVWAIAGDTDGIDGSEENAGALVTPTTLARARALGVDARRYLAAHDAYDFFAALGDLVVTGPTRTNVNDFRALIIVR